MPPAARVTLQPDEYIDQAGVVRTNRVVRQNLEAAPPVDFPDVIVDGVAVVSKPKRKAKLRRDRRSLEDDEYIAVDMVTGEKIIKTGAKKR